jgi:hypothetical protein
MFKRRRHLYMAIIDSIFFLVAGGYIMPQWSVWYKLQSSSSLATAIVVHHLETRVTSSIGQVRTIEPYYIITYTFDAPTPDGLVTHFTHNQEGTAPFYQHLSLGTPVTIRYVRDNPTISVIENNQSNSVMIFWTILMVGHWGLHLIIIISELIRTAHVRITFGGKEY